MKLKKGFTLVELTITVAVLVTFSFAIGSVFVRLFGRQHDDAANTLRVYETQGSMALEQMVRDIRNSNYVVAVSDTNTADFSSVVTIPANHSHVLILGVHDYDNDPAIIYYYITNDPVITDSTLPEYNKHELRRGHSPPGADLPAFTPVLVRSVWTEPVQIPAQTHDVVYRPDLSSPTDLAGVEHLFVGVNYNRTSIPVATPAPPPDTPPQVGEERVFHFQAIVALRN
ncbi:MAG: type II secretion system GspH family protein [Defluviitaleaceae bacterium]|nr:type II secretion system GspH family protein [Defluviitaleaceae bacterium]